MHAAGDINSIHPLQSELAQLTSGAKVYFPPTAYWTLVTVILNFGDRAHAAEAARLDLFDL